MAKKNILGSLLTLGGLAAAGAVVYKRREEIRQILDDAAARWFPDDAEDADVEPDVIIDITIDETQSERKENETVEETPEN